jgi:membrane-bound serine protease (ClpP class)
MRPEFVIAVIAFLAIMVLLIIAALSRHKKAGSGDIKLIDQIAQVDRQLDPEGTVIVRGELWRAKSNDGSTIFSQTRVRVVGFEDHFVLVKLID